MSLTPSALDKKASTLVEKKMRVQVANLKIRLTNIKI